MNHGYAREPWAAASHGLAESVGHQRVMNGSMGDESFVLLEATRAAWAESCLSGMHAGDAGSSRRYEWAR